MYTISQIETGIITALQSTPLSSYCTVVEPYGGQFEKQEPDAIKEVIDSFPVVYILFRGSGRGSLPDSLETADEGSFTVMVAAENLRGYEEALDAPGGVYQMCEDVEELLAENDLGLSGLWGLTLRNRNLFAAFDSVCVYNLDFDYAFAVDAVATPGPAPAVEAAINVKLANVVDIGNVYATDGNFPSKFKCIINSVPQIRGWEIERRERTAENDNNAEMTSEADYIVKGFFRIPKTSGTESTFRALVEGVQNEFRFYNDLPEPVENTGAMRVQTIGVKFLYNLPVHYCELAIPCTERKER